MDFTSFFDSVQLTSEGNVNHGALVGHETGQGLNLLEIHSGGVTDTPLAGKPVVRVLSTVGLNGLHTSVVPPDGEAAEEDTNKTLPHGITQVV